MAGITQSSSDHHHFYGIDEKTKMMNDFDPSSGSGAGEAVLVQRTIGLDLMRYNLVGKGRYGEVWRANYRGSLVAVKVIYMNCFVDNNGACRFGETAYKC